jgi:hypothetical protein
MGCPGVGVRPDEKMFSDQGTKVSLILSPNEGDGIGKKAAPEVPKLNQGENNETLGWF